MRKVDQYIADYKAGKVTPLQVKKAVKSRLYKEFWGRLYTEAENHG